MNRKSALAAVAMLALLSAGGCETTSHEQTGAVVGGVAGAVLGSQVGEGKGQHIAIAIGAIAGTMIGASIGRHMDEQDRHLTGMALENNRTRQTSRWRNPDTGYQFAVTPTRTFQEASGPCREFTMTARIDETPQKVFGTACRQPDGTWQLTK